MAPLEQSKTKLLLEIHYHTFKARLKFHFHKAETQLEIIYIRIMFSYIHTYSSIYRKDYNI